MSDDLAHRNKSIEDWIQKVEEELLYTPDPLLPSQPEEGIEDHVFLGEEATFINYSTSNFVWYNTTRNPPLSYYAIDFLQENRKIHKRFLHWLKHFNEPYQKSTAFTILYSLFWLIITVVFVFCIGE